MLPPLYTGRSCLVFVYFTSLLTYSAFLLEDNTSYNKKGVTSTAVDIGGATVVLPYANYIVCHFGATYIGSSTSDPPFLS